MSKKKKEKQRKKFFALKSYLSTKKVFVIFYMSLYKDSRFISKNVVLDLPTDHIIYLEKETILVLPKTLLLL